MASHLDLEEQEQLEQLKAFWKRWGNLITWGLTLVLGVFAAYNYWNYRARTQGIEAGAMYEQFEAAVQVADADKVGAVFNDLKERFGGTSYAAQAALKAARVQFDKGQVDKAKESLVWAADHAAENEYREIARLRLAGLHLDAKQYDEAAKVLDAIKSAEFAAPVADRRGDLLMLQGKPEQAKAEYQKAMATIDKAQEYRQVVEAKLASLGVAPVDEAAEAAAKGASK